MRLSVLNITHEGWKTTSLSEHPSPSQLSPLRPSAAPPMWDAVLHESHNILSLHRNGFLSVSSSLLRWLPLLHLLPMLYEWWQRATGFHWDLIKCEGPCGCSLIERRFNRAAQGRLIHQPATIQRAPGYRWQWWRARWLTQWRCVWVSVCTCAWMLEYVGAAVWEKITTLAPALAQALKWVMFDGTDIWYLTSLVTQLFDIRRGLQEHGSSRVQGLWNLESVSLSYHWLKMINYHLHRLVDIIVSSLCSQDANRHWFLSLLGVSGFLSFFLFLLKPIKSVLD